MAHVHEKIDFTTAVFIVNDNKVLLRFHDKYNFWWCPGGHIELDEDPNEAVLREAKEETGLDIELWEGNRRLLLDDKDGKELVPPVALNRHFVNEHHEHINMLYFASSKEQTLNPSVEEKEVQFKWCTKQDLETMDLRKDARFYANLALEILSS